MTTTHRIGQDGFSLISALVEITRTDGGPLVRSCSTARRGGCAAGGRW